MEASMWSVCPVYGGGTQQAGLGLPWTREGFLLLVVFAVGFHEWVGVQQAEKSGKMQSGGRGMP